ncbi:glycoside hydrolase [Penicillium cosmopolitanum]|uniref:Glycoside hydrolase n=1 Tax=Penicillium cosmopolitanum TaxID=1131564 RepID=A0A9W9VX82_9EURO|nr:glycoside hydrolase [Penicillium cosmopolitanum]KAJ5391059.1 glycoside hydrolase [Penicillium cosmopolitanum]
MKYSLMLAGAATAISVQANPSISPQPLSFRTTLTVNTAKRYQTMIGGGCSGAFGAACQTNSLSTADQQTVVKALFDENLGALSILRNIIGSSTGATILSECPATPAGPFNYSFPTSSNDSCQLTLAQNALQYNPDLFLYADAWSAPGCFKTTGQEAGGGYLCGVRGSNCTEDWREAYANYLIEYVKLYEQRGIKVSMLGAYNEPDFNPFTYSAMLSDGYQAYDFLSVLYPMVKRTFPNLAVSCCDSTGARQQRDLLYELGRLGGLNMFDINTYHNYQSDIKVPFEDLLHSQPTIETEWSDGGSTWTPTWDISGNNFEGLQWAIYMHNAFRNNVAGWSHWWCAWSGGDAALVNVNGDSYQIAARLWAFSSYFRFARPGAVRIYAETNVEDLYITAWMNTNSTIAIPVVNAAHYTYTLDVQLYGSKVSHAVAYLTDNEHNVTVDNEFIFKEGRFTAQIEPRAMKTFFLDF